MPGVAPTRSASGSDDDLVWRLRKGDMDAFRAVYEKHRARVYGICLRMTSDASEALDLAQEAFLRMYEQIGSLRESGKFTSWFDRLTCNVVLVHFRKRRRMVLPEQDEEHGSPFDGLPDPRDAPPIESLDVERALQQLPAGYRMVFLLYAVHGYTHEEIAVEIGCSVSTSKTQLFKARKRLLQLLSEGSRSTGLNLEHSDGA